MQKVSKKRAQEITKNCECPGLPMGCPVDCCAYCGLYDQCNYICSKLFIEVSETAKEGAIVGAE
jgi:hypothetical protein